MGVRSTCKVVCGLNRKTGKWEGVKSLELDGYRAEFKKMMLDPEYSEKYEFIGLMETFTKMSKTAKPKAKKKKEESK